MQRAARSPPDQGYASIRRVTRRDVLVAAAATLASVRIGRGNEASATRLDESRELRAFAESVHPRGVAIAADPAWKSRWDRLHRDADQLADGAYVVRIRQALALLADGHTNVLPFEYTGGIPQPMVDGPFRYGLPFRVKVFSDGVWVTAAAGSAQPLSGSKIVQLGNATIEEIMRSDAAAWPGNDAWAQNWAHTALSSPALLQGLSVWPNLSEPLRVVALNPEGHQITTELAAQVRNSIALADVPHAQSPVEQWAQTARSGNYLRFLGSSRTLFVSIDAMEDSEQEPFGKFGASVIDAMARPAAQRLILDIRRNGGGDNALAEPLRKSIERSRFNQPGRLYVLIGPATFSAAQNFATRLERETFASFVGEPTGGAPNHFGDPKIYQGPSSGLTAIVSTLLWQDSAPQDTRPWILPDEPAPRTFRAWQDGYDHALEAVLKHHKAPADRGIAQAQAAPFERASQKAGWRFFWR